MNSVPLPPGWTVPWIRLYERARAQGADASKASTMASMTLAKLIRENRKP